MKNSIIQHGSNISSTIHEQITLYRGIFRTLAPSHTARDTANMAFTPS